MAKPTVNIYEAKTGLSRLITRAERGEDVIIARAGKPVARLARLDPPTRRVRFGVLKGRVRVADDFDAPLPEEVLAAFEGR
jgi:antitoxin (DNA-binding transcriptional repressor) of toxin-antitoxin stability system